MWYRKERHEDVDPDVIGIEWARKYGEAWRIHRTREVIYVFRRESEMYLNLVCRYAGLV